MKSTSRTAKKTKEAAATLALPYYSTELGQAFLGDSLDLLKEIQSESVNLILTSPPFALTRKKEYGNKSASEYVDWFLQFAPDLKRVLTQDGSLVLDLGSAYLPGFPIRSTYQFELLIKLVNECGFFLAQDFYHYNPSRLPTPAEWVTVRRIRVKDSINTVWWLSVSEYPKADNRQVLKPYSESMKQLIKNGYTPKLRPSGHDISNKFQKDNQGAIPPNLLELANTESNSAYMRRCREANIKPHPARFPEGLADFFIRFLTSEKDTVLDPFAGSNTTGLVAERLRRKWIAIEINSSYLDGSILRFQEVNDLLPVARRTDATPDQIRPLRETRTRHNG